MAEHQFFQQLINGIALGGVYALVALGYTMVYGIIELINFAHGDVYTLGTFFSLSIITLIPLSKFTAGYELWIIAFAVIVLAALLCGIVGVLIERLAYRRLRNAPRLAPLITAIGVSLILENIMQLWKGPSEVSFPQFLPDRIHTLGGIEIRDHALLVVFVSIACMVALNILVFRTKLGTAMRATAQDRDAAQLMGVDPPPEIPFAQAAPTMSAMALSFWQECRRVKNNKLKRELGVSLRYPTYREGLRALFDEQKT